MPKSHTWGLFGLFGVDGLVGLVVLFQSYVDLYFVLFSVVSV